MHHRSTLQTFFHFPAQKKELIVKKKKDYFSPSEQTIQNILNFSKALEVQSNGKIKIPIIKN